MAACISRRPSADRIFFLSHCHLVGVALASHCQQSETATGLWSKPKGSTKEGGRPMVRQDGRSSAGKATKSSWTGLPCGEIQDTIGRLQKSLAWHVSSLCSSRKCWNDSAFALEGVLSAAVPTKPASRNRALASKQSRGQARRGIRRHQ